MRDPAYDPGLWVLAVDREGLSGAVLGRVERLADVTAGVVTHVNVAPRARGRGLAAALLGTLCRRFQAHGLAVAQLGVHEDNASGAPGLYEHLGWTTVSRRTRWQPPNG